jgi:histone-lysine N-methyltransferase SETMAR
MQLSRKMTSTNSKENRTVIKFLTELGNTPTQTYELMQRTSMKSSVSRALVFRWHRRFKDGQKQIEDEPGRGRKSIIDATLIESVKDVVYGDRRVTIRDICDLTGYSYGTVQKVLEKHLNMHKVSARWIPRILSNDNKSNRVKASRKFLERYRKEGDTFLQRIITTDETWLFLYDPETKEQSKQWKTPASPPPKKARVSKSAGKQMFIFFADIDGMILQHAVPTGKTVNANYYSKVFIVYVFK